MLKVRRQNNKIKNMERKVLLKIQIQEKENNKYKGKI